MSVTQRILSHPCVWDKLKDEKSPIVIYGTGNGADTVLDIFEKYGIKASAVCASDGFVRSREFHGFKVIGIQQVISDFDTPLFCLCFASCIPSVTQSIIKLSRSDKLLVPVVPVFGNDIINKAFLECNRAKIDAAYELLCDRDSRSVFENILTFEFTGELDYLLQSESKKSDALLKLLKLSSHEHYADLGAYRGDTLEELVNLTGGFEKAYAFEPDPKTFKKLSASTEGVNNLWLFPYALWNKDTQLGFSGNGGRQSSLSLKESKLSVKAVALDNILKDTPITYIKADVEGAEKEAIIGMSRILKEQKPKLCISAYHRSSDIFDLILQIRQINPQYKFFLRHHHYIPAWDTNIYCI